MASLSRRRRRGEVFGACSGCFRQIFRRQRALPLTEPRPSKPRWVLRIAEGTGVHVAGEGLFAARARAINSSMGGAPAPNHRRQSPRESAIPGGFAWDGSVAVNRDRAVNPIRRVRPVRIDAFKRRDAQLRPLVARRFLVADQAPGLQLHASFADHSLASRASPTRGRGVASVGAERRRKTARP